MIKCLILKHRLRGWGVPIFLQQNRRRSAILNGRAMEIDTIVYGIMHCIYAKFHVDLMYDSEVMNQKVSKFGIFLDLSAEKVKFFP